MTSSICSAILVSAEEAYHQAIALSEPYVAQHPDDAAILPVPGHFATPTSAV